MVSALSNQWYPLLKVRGSVSPQLFFNQLLNLHPAAFSVRNFLVRRFLLIPFSLYAKTRIHYHIPIVLPRVKPLAKAKSV